MIKKFIVKEDFQHGIWFKKGQILIYDKYLSEGGFYFYQDKISNAISYSYAKNLCVTENELNQYIKEDKIIVIEYT
jgi:hypothetical protein